MKFEIFYTNFFVFWARVNFLAWGNFDYAVGAILLSSIYWITDVVILVNIPYAGIGLSKYLQHQYDGQEKMSDLIRATIVVREDEPEKILKILHTITSSKAFNLIRIKDRLKALRHVNTNFVFMNKCVCEIQIRLGAPPPHYHANHFLYEIERMQQPFEIVETLNNKAVWLAEHNMLLRKPPAVWKSRSNKNLKVSSIFK